VIKESIDAQNKTLSTYGDVDHLCAAEGDDGQRAETLKMIKSQSHTDMVEVEI